MRFLMLNWRDPLNPKAGGAERVTLAYLRALQERGHEVFWYANDFPGCRSEEVVHGIPVVRGGNSGRSILRARAWYKRQQRFDLVIDQHHGIPWYAPWWCGTNCVAYIHEVLGPIWNAFYSWPMNIIGQVQERWTHRLYGRVPFWTPSNSTREALHRNGVREVKVLPNGTDTVPLPSLADKPLSLPVRLIAVSRLAPNKRVGHAIETTRLLHDRGVAVRLTILGTGEQEEHLRNEARHCGLGDRVTFAGHVTEEEKNRRLSEAHLLVHTSIREGWGLNVIEANAMGTPAVVYPVGGLVDSTVHEQTGLIVDRESPAAVADAVQGLLNTPEKYTLLRQNAWERSRTFVWSHVLPLACDWLEAQARRRR